MSNFMTIARDNKLNRSEDLAMFGGMIADDIGAISNEEDVDYDHTHFLRLEGSKLVFVIGCMSLEYLCEDVTDAIKFLNGAADAARDDQGFQTLFNASVAHEDRQTRFEVPLGSYDSYYLSEMEKHRLYRSTHVRLIAEWLSEDIARLRSGEADDNGAMYRKQGSAYVVNFFTHELEYALPTLDALLPFLESAADAVREDDEFQQKLDETWQHLCQKRVRERAQDEQGVNAMVGDDYEEYHPETLRGFHVNCDGFERRFDTLEEAFEYANSIADTVYKLSSVDHYQFDCNERDTVH